MVPLEEPQIINLFLNPHVPAHPTAPLKEGFRNKYNAGNMTNHKLLLIKWEHPERLRSEDTPTAPWLPILLIYIGFW